IFSADAGSGRHIFAHEIATGKTRQLTNDSRISATASCPHPTDADQVLSVRDGELLRIRVSTGAVQVVGSVPSQSPIRLGQPTVNGAGAHAAVGFQRDGNTWEVGRFDLKTGEYKTVIQQGFNLG